MSRFNVNMLKCSILVTSKDFPKYDKNVPCIFSSLKWVWSQTSPALPSFMLQLFHGSHLNCIFTALHHSLQHKLTKYFLCKDKNHSLTKLETSCRKHKKIKHDTEEIRKQNSAIQHEIWGLKEKYKHSKALEEYFAVAKAEREAVRQQNDALWHEIHEMERNI